MNKTVKAARRYLARGWQPVPVYPRTKKPVGKDWQNRRLRPEDLPKEFADGRNIGLLLGNPSGGLTDVDLDWPEARALARFFLPTTGLVSGHALSPESHLWFITDPVVMTMKFLDPTLLKTDERAMIVELRSTGGQTVVPPSVHPNGHPYIWHKDGEPAKVSARELQRAVGGLAAAALLARHWQTGKRHELALALSGALIRAGWSVEQCEHFIDAVTYAASDEEARLRLADIRSTLERIKNDQPATGLPTLAELLDSKIVSKMVTWLNLPNREPGMETESESEPSGSKRTTQAQVLIQLAESQARFFHTSEHEAYADIQNNGHTETWPVRSKAFRRWLLREFYQLQSKPPAAQSLQDALSVIEAKAMFDSIEREIFVRVGEHGGNIYIDLCDANWQAIEITSGGWRVVADPPVRFRRARGMLPLPYPVAGGKLGELRRFINVASDDDFVLILAWLLAAFRPTGPFPALTLHGEQGSAKSTASRVLRELIDPNSAALRSEPRDVRDLMIAANNAWCLAFDNLSHLPAWLSDVFCRLASGGGFSTRELYSDSDEVLFDSQRPIILNAIEEIATRGDLLGRALIVHLPRITDERRIAEKNLWREFEKAKPLILGALLDAVSVALRTLPTVTLPNPPRMADFAVWSTAAEPALGCARGAFMRAYSENRESANELTLEASPVAAAVRELAESSEWAGIASELLDVLNERANEKTRRQKAWPTTPRALSNALRRLAPNLRAVGVDVKFDRKPDRSRRRLIQIRKCENSYVHNVHNVHNVDSASDLADATLDANSPATELASEDWLFASENQDIDSEEISEFSDASDASDADFQDFSKNDSLDDCCVCRVFQERGERQGCLVHFPDSVAVMDEVPF